MIPSWHSMRRRAQCCGLSRAFRSIGIRTDPQTHAVDVARSALGEKKRMENGKRETGDLKPVNAPPPRLPVRHFPLPISGFPFLSALALSQRVQPRRVFVEDVLLARRRKI